MLTAAFGKVPADLMRRVEEPRRRRAAHAAEGGAAGRPADHLAAVILDFAFAVGMVEIALIVGGGPLNVPYLPVAILQRSTTFAPDIPLTAAMAVVLVVIALIGQVLAVVSTRRRRAVLPASGFRRLTRVGTILCAVAIILPLRGDGAVLAVPGTWRRSPASGPPSGTPSTPPISCSARFCIPSRYPSPAVAIAVPSAMPLVVRDGPLGLRRQAADQPDDPAADAAARAPRWAWPWWSCTTPACCPEIPALAFLIAAHVVIVLPVIARPVIAALEQMDAELETASMSLGASPVRTVRKITVPVDLPDGGGRLRSSAWPGASPTSPSRCSWSRWAPAHVHRDLQLDELQHPAADQQRTP